MGTYDALGPIIRRTLDAFIAREERWREQEDDVLEAMQWHAFLEDAPGLDRLCGVIEKTKGFESLKVKKALSVLFRNAAVPPALQVRAGQCLKNTDWSKATDDIFARSPSEDTVSDLDPPEVMQAMLCSPHKSLREVWSAVITGVGIHIEHAAVARNIFESVAADITEPDEVRNYARSSGEIMKSLQSKRAKKLVTVLETNTYYPRPRVD